MILGLVLIFTGIIFNPWILARFFTVDREISFPKTAMIGLADIFFIFFGYLAIKCQSPLRTKELTRTLIVLLAVLVSLELGLRVYFATKNAISEKQKMFCEDLGWRNRPYFHSSQELPGYGRVDFSTTRDGFRCFGNPQTAKKKILLIGDSFTDASTVSDGKTYYDELRRRFGDVEIFAYGCGGYGSLQEYMILDRYVGVIAPDIVLWQFSENDFINNDLELESRSYVNNNEMKRPYYSNGRVQLVFPKKPGQLSLIEHSTLLRFLYVTFTHVSHLRSTVEMNLNRQDPWFQRSFAITSRIMAMAKERAVGRSFLVFSSDQTGWSEASLKEICQKNGIGYIPGIAGQIARAKESGTKVDGSPFDEHWNETGHRIVGEVLADFLSKDKTITELSQHQ